MGLSEFTLIHIVISLIALISGLAVLGGWMAGMHLRGWTGLFLATTVLTSVTGFFFPFRGFTPAYAVGGLSLVILAVAIYALSVKQLAGKWRKIYVFTALTALYLNVFVLVAQLFQKTPALKELAPTQTEPAFGLVQGLILVLFLVFGFRARAAARVSL